MVPTRHVDRAGCESDGQGPPVTSPDQLRQQSTNPASLDCPVGRQAWSHVPTEVVQQPVGQMQNAATHRRFVACSAGCCGRNYASSETLHANRRPTDRRPSFPPRQSADRGWRGRYPSKTAEARCSPPEWPADARFGPGASVAPRTRRNPPAGLGRRSQALRSHVDMSHFSAVLHATIRRWARSG